MAVKWPLKFRKTPSLHFIRSFVGFTFVYLVMVKCTYRLYKQNFEVVDYTFRFQNACLKIVLDIYNNVMSFSFKIDLRPFKNHLCAKISCYRKWSRYWIVIKQCHRALNFELSLSKTIWRVGQQISIGYSFFSITASQFILPTKDALTCMKLIICHLSDNYRSYGYDWNRKCSTTLCRHLYV